MSLRYDAGKPILFRYLAARAAERSTMIGKEDQKSRELADDEIERAAGGEDRQVSKKCLNCGRGYEFSLGKCPACGSDKNLLVWKL